MNDEATEFDGPDRKFGLEADIQQVIAHMRHTGAYNKECLARILADYEAVKKELKELKCQRI